MPRRVGTLRRKSVLVYQSICSGSCVKSCCTLVLQFVSFSRPGSQLDRRQDNRPAEKRSRRDFASIQMQIDGFPAGGSVASVCLSYGMRGGGEKRTFQRVAHAILCPRSTRASRLWKVAAAKVAARIAKLAFVHTSTHKTHKETWSDRNKYA